MNELVILLLFFSFCLFERFDRAADYRGVCIECLMTYVIIILSGGGGIIFNQIEKSEKK